MEKHITATLQELGIPVNLSGFHYLRTAITTVVRKKNVNIYMVPLYQDVAKEYNSVSTRVERAMRHAIEVGVERGNPDKWNALFKYSYSAAKGKPTNSEFIATLAEHIRLNHGTNAEG